MQNSMLLVLLRPIFAPKMKIAPLPMGYGSRSCEGLAVNWTSIVNFFGSGVHAKSAKTFFWRSPNFDRKNASIYLKTNENLGQVRLRLFQTSKNAPLCEILATRLDVLGNLILDACTCDCTLLIITEVS